MRTILLTLISVTFIFSFAVQSAPAFAVADIVDGDLLTTEDSLDIYIVKVIPSASSGQDPSADSGQVKKFKRLILNPDIFNSYGHLKWENVKIVPQSILDGYALSEFVIEVNADGTVYDPNVYKVSSALDSDKGERRWLSVTSDEFESLGFDWDSIYHINHTEASEDFYPLGSPLTFSDLSPAPIAPVEEEKVVEEPVVFFARPECDAEIPTSHASIQVAIDAANIGDTICLLAGTYKENILIDGKDIILSGTEGATTKIMAVRETEMPDTVNSEKNSALVIKNVSATMIIENLTITNGNYYAIWLDNASPIIKNNIIKDNFAGVRILGNSRPSIKNNVFDNNTHGSAIVFNGNVGDWVIDHNTFLDNGNTGDKATVLFDSALTSTQIKITNNIFSGGVIGVHEARPTNSVINNNLFYGQSQNYVRKAGINYNSISLLNGLTFAINNILGNPLIGADYKLGIYSIAIDKADDRASNIGAY